MLNIINAHQSFNMKTKGGIENFQMVKTVVLDGNGSCKPYILPLNQSEDNEKKDGCV